MGAMNKNCVNRGSPMAESISVAFNLPVVGLNDNMEFLGRQLHVQTEYMEMPAARITTEVFCSGRVMLSKKLDCPPAILASHDIGQLQQLMNTQHQQVIQEIREKQARVLNTH